MKVKGAIYQGGSLWGNREFVLLISASLLLSIGNKVYELLLPLILYDLSGGSSIVMTSMRTAELLPNLFFGILVGVIVDRVNKKKWATWMIALQSIILIVIYFLFGLKIYQPIVFYILGFMLMTLNYGFFNTQISLIKWSVPSLMLTSANARFSFVETFVGIMGPVFLGIVLLVGTKTQGLIITIVLYLLAYTMILNLSYQEAEQIRGKSSFWKDFKDGWSVFVTNKKLKMMTIFVILLNCTMIIVSSTVLFFGTFDLKFTNSTLSMFLSISGVGGLLASLSISWLRRKSKLGKIIGFSILGNAISYLVLYISDTHFILLGLSLMLSGYSTTIYIICVYTFRHEQTPANLIGRISGITGTLFRVGMPITMLFSGWMINWWGASSVFISAGIANIVFFVFYKKSILWNIH